MDKITGRGNPSDHLANERTFLAWVRTSIGIMAFGFVVVKFTLFVKQLAFVLRTPVPAPTHGYSSVMGVFLVAFGALTGLLSFVRYKRVESQLNDNDYKHSPFLTSLLALFIIIMGILLVVYLIHSVS
jgi:putative membrane protein